jgi:hypothetical protein
MDMQFPGQLMHGFFCTTGWLFVGVEVEVEGGSNRCPQNALPTTVNPS